MKIQYISDIHLEFLSSIPKIDQIGDVLVLAGDIGHPFSDIYKDFLIDMNKKFKKVFLITGNHEFYFIEKDRRTMEEIDDKIKYIINENNLNNITYLDDSYEDYEGVRFCGATLWTKIINKQYINNDFKFIKDMSIEFRNELFNNSYEFINGVINNSNLPIIIITHHLPSYDLINQVYRTNEFENFTQCYASDCSKLFKDPIKIWIFGHTHKECDTEINGIKFLCNPIGYPNENKIMDYCKVVEI
jgi:predicted phosphodiesterase